jgi:ABC-type phosphate/phosphonate transport system, periplasmic component
LLVGHSIITMPSPSLGYVLLLEMYSNPVSQPDIRSTAGAWRDAIDSVFGGDDDAAIIPTWLKNQYPNLITVKTTRQFAGTCVTAGADVPEEVRQKVKDALLKLDADEQTAKLPDRTRRQQVRGGHAERLRRQRKVAEGLSRLLRQIRFVYKRR